MNRSFMAFMFGAALASPFAALIATHELPPHVTPPSMGKFLDEFPENGVFDCARACPTDRRVDQTDYQIEQCETKCGVEWIRDPAVINVGPVTIVGHVARSPRPKPPSAPACHLRPLEQGGSPDHPFVLACG